jgi:cyanophycin synthetase
VTEKTSSLAINWAKDKFTTAYLLNSMGYPGAKHQLIRDEEQLKNAIVALGFPLVIKPRDQEQGRGVSADLRHEDDVISAYRAAQKFSKQILLEKHQDGNTHRLTVIGGELIKVVKRIPGGVYGDGQHAIRDLISLELSTEKNQSRIKRTVCNCMFMGSLETTRDWRTGCELLNADSQCRGASCDESFSQIWG